MFVRVITSVADPDPYGMFVDLPDPDPIIRGLDPATVSSIKQK